MDSLEHEHAQHQLDDEKTIANNSDSDSATEDEYINVDNGPKGTPNQVSTLNNLHNPSESRSPNSFQTRSPVLKLRAKLPQASEWEVFTHIKMTKHVECAPLPVQFKDDDNIDKLYGFNPPLNRRDTLSLMLSQYDLWRKEYNKVNGYNTVEENGGERCDVIPIPAEESPVEVEERESTPDINDDHAFPSLGGRPSLSRTASLPRRPSSVKPVIDVVDIDDEPDAKDDPDDEDFVPTREHRKKKNKKTVYKKADDNIFDFQETATAWQSNSEVAESSKRPEAITSKPEPVVQEETVACPICGKHFPMTQIEGHASDCMFEDAGQSRTRAKASNPRRIEDIGDDAILISDDEKSPKKADIVKQYQPTKKRVLTDEDSDAPSQSKKACRSPDR